MSGIIRPLHHVATRPFADVIKAAGTAKANESVAVRSKVADTITKVLFDSGDYVSEDQLLVELVNTEEAAALSEARATLAEAKRRSTRISELSRNDFASAQLIDETSADTKRASAKVRAIEARLADRLIRAPISGVIGLRNISAGERIDTGTVIATLNDIKTIKLDFDVPERFLSALATGQAVNATASAYPDTIFSGVITDIDNQVNPRSRTVAVRAMLSNPKAELIPGMLLSVNVKRNEREKTAIPESSLLRIADQAFVFILAPQTDETSSVIRQPVTVGLRSSGYIEVLEGLEDGDLIVTEGVHRVQNGAEVKANIIAEKLRTPEG